MSLLVISIICFLIFYWLIKSLEVKEHYEWIPLKLPLWGWICVVVVCLMPIINMIAIVAFLAIAISEANDRYSEYRFKHHSFLDKIKQFLNKKY